MKKLTFTVTLTFSNKIKSEDAIQEITENIANALLSECDNGNGLAPEDSGFTQKIHVSENTNPKWYESEYTIQKGTFVKTK